MIPNGCGNNGKGVFWQEIILVEQCHPFAFGEL
jgi:hypothetical protein